MKCWAMVCASLALAWQLVSCEEAMLNQCSELKAQEHLDLNELMGKWYVVEVMEHKASDSRQAAAAASGNVEPQRLVVDACPIVHLKSIESRSAGRDGPPRISLLWEEEAGNLEYTYWVSHNRGPGVWNSDVVQNGTLANKPSYKQFVGTVHVMKAVATHIVLTFCSRTTEGQKFSVLLGRDYKLPHWDVVGVQRLLGRRDLKILSLRESCKHGGASASQPVLLLALISLVFCALLPKHLVN